MPEVMFTSPSQGDIFVLLCTEETDAKRIFLDTKLII